MMTEVVLVTGGSGCLGQFIVKLLQEKDDTVKEIRVFDLVPYENKLSHDEKKPIKKIVGDIRDKAALIEATVGVDCVIHTAAAVDLSMFPDHEKLHSTNLDGTRNVIDACLKNNVPRLVYTSTVDIMFSGEHIFYGMESTTVVPKKFPLGPYAETKAKAEELVLKTGASGGTVTEDGKTKLRALALRCSPFYGEQDKNFVTAMLKKAKENGSVTRIHSLDERLQIMYVGNAAWGHIKAKERLAVDESISGEEFYLTDDTPIIDLYENIRPYVEAHKDKLSDYVLPYWLIYLSLLLFTLILKLIRPIYKINTKIPPPGLIAFLCSTIFFNRSKSTLRLNYTPLYNAEESQKRSVEYYTNVKV